MANKSKRKAAKVQRGYDDRERDWSKVGDAPGPTVSERIESLGSEVTDALEHLVDLGVLEREPDPNIDPDTEQTPVQSVQYQPRWEVILNSDGKYTVTDSLTSLHAVYGPDDKDKFEASGDADALAKGYMLIGALRWIEPTTGAEATISSSRENDRFLLIHHAETDSWAMFDKHSALVHPFLPDDSFETMETTVHEFNREPELWADDCRAMEFDEGDDPHWIDTREWITPPPEDTATDATGTPAVPPLAPVQREARVLVVSSSSWPWGGIVGEVIQQYWNQIGNPPLVLFTSGSNRGAEQAAQRIAEQVDGVRHEVLDDTNITPDTVDYAFAFIRNESEGASRILSWLKFCKIPVHVIAETTAKINDPWASR